MDLDGDEDRDDQARSKAMLETAFQSDAFERVPKRGPNLFIVVAVRQYAQFDAIYTAQMRRQVVGVALRSDPRTAEREVVEVWFTTLRHIVIGVRKYVGCAAVLPQPNWVQRLSRSKLLVVLLWVDRNVRSDDSGFSIRTLV